MKKGVLFIFVCAISSNLLSQNNYIIGNWIEYKRTLLNGEDGHKYTFNEKPFVPEFQFQFIKDSNKVIFFDGNTINEGNFFINSDTLIIEKKVIMFNSIQKTIEKYIFSNTKEGFVLTEFKPKLDESYLVRKFYFEKTNKSTIQTKKEDFPLSITDKPTVFIGGQDSLNTFIKRNVIYPNNLLTKKIEGKVFLKLTIDETGKIINAEIMSNPRLEFAKEALRVVRLMPSWEAGSLKGVKVKMYYNLPISFKLN